LRSEGTPEGDGDQRAANETGEPACGMCFHDGL
jgi:hypothetical protein